MKLTSMQFDGGDEGAYKEVTPPKPLAPVPSGAYLEGDDRIARNSAAAGRAAKAEKIATALTPTPGIPGDDAHKGMMARSNAMSPMTSTAKVAKAKTPVDKSGYDRSIKVSQSTVDSVKRAGAYGSQKNAKEGMPGYYGSELNPKAPASAEYKEAVKRVYPNPAKEPKAAAPKTAPKNYGGAAAEKYKAEEKNAKNKSALPPILPGAQNMPFTPGSGGKIEKMPFTPGSGGKIEKMPFKPLLPPVTPKATPKAAAPAKVKVSQATVDAVKSQGKAKAISNAKSNVSNAEYKEAVRRIYQSPAKPKAKAKSGGGGGKASSAVK